MRFSSFFSKGKTSNLPPPESIKEETGVIFFKDNGGGGNRTRVLMGVDQASTCLVSS